MPDDKHYKVQYEDLDTEIMYVEWGTFTLTAAQRYCERMNEAKAGKRYYSYYDIYED